jgi:DNA repair exonuclease SbcCD ATPase subunit
LKRTKNNLIELNKDHDFALSLDEHIHCPICGTVTENKIRDRISIINDLRNGNELLSELRLEIKEIDIEIANIYSNINDTRRIIINLEKQYKGDIETYSYVNDIVDKGKNEIIQHAHKEKDLLISELNTLLNQIQKLETKINNLKSKSLNTKISTEIKQFEKKLFELLDLPVNYIKLRDFVQETSKTGSDLPRVILAYHISVFLYNIKKERGLFNFLVVDTPNQQGQDQTNLDNINNVLLELYNIKCQFIIGTERTTGIEDMDNVNVIKLTKKRKCLDHTNYENHLQLVKKYN